MNEQLNEHLAKIHEPIRISSGQTGKDCLLDAGDRNSVARHLLKLILSKKELQKEIDEYRSLIASNAPEEGEVINLDGGASVRVLKSRLSFTSKCQKNDFQDLPEVLAKQLVNSGVISAANKVSLNEETVRKLPLEKLNDLIDQNIIKNRRIFVGHADRLASVDGQFKEALHAEGIIDLPTPQVRVFTSKPGRKRR